MSDKRSNRQTVFVLLEDTTPVPAYGDRTEAADIRLYFRVRDEADPLPEETRQQPVYNQSGGKIGYKVRTANGGPPWLDGKTWQLSSYFSRPSYVNDLLIPKWPTITPNSDRVVGRFWSATGIPGGMVLDEAQAPPEGATTLHGQGPPSDLVGAPGDYYVDDSRLEIYGPKEAAEVRLRRFPPRAQQIIWPGPRDMYTGEPTVRSPAWLRLVAPMIAEYDEQGQQTGSRPWDGALNDQIGTERWYGDSFLYWAKCEPE